MIIHRLSIDFPIKTTIYRGFSAQVSRRPLVPGDEVVMAYVTWNGEKLGIFDGKPSVDPWKTPRNG